MIKVLQKADIERVVDIWLDTNLKAHYFIPGQYWKDNIDLVKEMLPQAEVYVYENDCQIEGFIGLNDEYMEAQTCCGRRIVVHLLYLLEKHSGGSEQLGADTEHKVL